MLIAWADFGIVRDGDEISSWEISSNLAYLKGEPVLIFKGDPFEVIGRFKCLDI